MAGVAALALPQLATAGDVEEQMRLMDERMNQMESQLQATQDELEASKEEVDRQQEMIQKAGIEREAQSGLQKFLSDTQFSGNVAVSWGWNFNNPNPVIQAFDSTTAKGDNARGVDAPRGNSLSPTKGGINAGALGITAPFQSNHNTFQVDQVFLSMKKPATTESRGGFGVDLAWGVSADVNDAVGAAGLGLASGDLSHLYQAYVEYLAPLGPGFNIKAGRFGRLIGAESFREDEKWTITHGLVWAIQPVNHTGLMVSMGFENGLFFDLAAVNSYNNTMKDLDNDKGIMGSFGWQGERFGAKVSGFYGGNVDEHSIFGLVTAGAGPATSSVGTDRDKIGVIDAVFSFTPSDRFAAWLNFDWHTTQKSDNSGVDPMRVYALATAGRFGITESLGFALRYEWMYIENHPFLFCPAGGCAAGDIGPIFAPAGDDPNAQIMSMTGTFDYALTDNLMVRAEGRYDWASADSSPDNFFTSSQVGPGDDDFFTRRDQVLGMVQMLYSF